MFPHWTHWSNWIHSIAWIRTLATVFAALALASSPSVSGPNSGGVLALHWDGETVFTVANPPEFYCEFPISSCDELNVQGEGLDADPSLLYVYAVFPDAVVPSLAEAAFGIVYDQTTLFFVEDAGCADFQVPQSGWPSPGTGTFVKFLNPREEHFTQIHMFAGYEYYGNPTSFDLIPHPELGGIFRDASDPPNEDVIVDYGSIGFNGTPGHVACPDSDAIGACCFAYEPCAPSTEEGCLDDGGTFLGEGIVCDPDPCPIPPLGACCFFGGGCSQLLFEDCLDTGGGYRGTGSVCEPNPCPQNCVANSPTPQAGTVRDVGDADPNVVDRVMHASDPNVYLTPEAGHGPNVYLTSESGSGPNAGGSLVLHSNPGVVFSFGEDYCGVTAITSCEETLPQAAPTDRAVVHVLAAFPSDAAPRLSRVTFGLEYESCVHVSVPTSCGNSEVPGADWPGPGTGTSVLWDTPRNGQLEEVYWFAAYTEAGQPAWIELTSHPEFGATFADDSIPPVVDSVSELGLFGFYAPGLQRCPEQTSPHGGCCYEGEDCVLQTAVECFLGGGLYLGDGSDCQDCSTTDVATDGSLVKRERLFALVAEPNPARDEIQVRFRLPESGPVSLTLFDSHGRRVAVLLDGPLGSGWQSVRWTGVGPTGERLAAGAYFLRMEHRGHSETRAIRLLPSH